MRNHRYSVVLGLIGVGALVFGIYLGHLFACGSGPCTHGLGTYASSAGSGGSATPVEIAGSATRAMSPGRGAPLNLQLTNRTAFAMSVRDLLVTVQQVTAPRSGTRRPCTTDDFTVTQVDPGLEITLAANGSTSLRDHHIATTAWPQVSMVDTAANQDGCRTATLTLRYTASGTKAEQ